MIENMRISVNGQSQVPPGFRFHPTEEELLYYYLRKKVSFEKIDLDVIRDVDLNKLEPWDIQETCKIGTTPQNDWYFFSHKDKKYPTGTRTNRATAAGFWKATGRDKVIYSNGRRIGMRKTLVFYKGRAPHGQKSDWIMHEYRLDDNIVESNVSNVLGEAAQEEGWVVCRIFKKKNLNKTLDSAFSSPANQIFGSCNEGTVDQILQYMGRTSCKEENEPKSNTRLLTKPINTTISNNETYQLDKFMKLPSLESPNSSSGQTADYPAIINESAMASSLDSGLTNWAALDRLVASQLNGQTESSRQLGCFNDPTMAYNDLQMPTLRQSFCVPSDRPPYVGNQQDYNNEIDQLWNFTNRSSATSDPLCHVSNSSI